MSLIVLAYDGAVGYATRARSPHANAVGVLGVRASEFAVNHFDRRVVVNVNAMVYPDSQLAVCDGGLALVADDYAQVANAS